MFSKPLSSLLLLAFFWIQANLVWANETTYQCSSTLNCHGNACIGAVQINGKAREVGINASAPIGDGDLILDSMLINTGQAGKVTIFCRYSTLLGNEPKLVTVTSDSPCSEKTACRSLQNDTMTCSCIKGE